MTTKPKFEDIENQLLDMQIDALTNYEKVLAEFVKKTQEIELPSSRLNLDAFSVLARVQSNAMVNHEEVKSLLGRLDQTRNPPVLPGSLKA